MGDFSVVIDAVGLKCGRVVAWCALRDRLAVPAFLVRGFLGVRLGCGVDRGRSVGSGGAGLGGRVVVADDVVPPGFGFCQVQ